MANDVCDYTPRAGNGMNASNLQQKVASYSERPLIAEKAPASADKRRGGFVLRAHIVPALRSKVSNPGCLLGVGFNGKRSQ